VSIATEVGRVNGEITGLTTIAGNTSATARVEMGTALQSTDTTCLIPGSPMCFG
jgi:hypothetical protein